MEELTVAAPKDEPRPWPDALWLVLLLALVLPLRLWLLGHTEVPARDSIGFIRYALQFQSQPWAEVVRHNHQHPGYPLTVLAASVPVRLFSAQPDAFRMQLAAQLASGLAAVLLVFPMFYLGKRLFDARVGFWAALLFQCLPVTGHVLSDGLSEALFLLLTATTLCLAGRALDGGSPGRFALCGAACGLTYLTRPEGFLLLASALAVLLALQLAPRWRRSWRSLARCGLALVAAAAVVGAPYVAATGRLSTKPSFWQFFNQGTGDAAPAAAGAAGPLLAVVLTYDGPMVERLGVGLWSLGTELVKGLHYAGWLPAVLGMFCYRGRVRHVPVMGMVLVLCGLHALVLWRLAVVVGYVSDRHIQLLVLGAVYPAAAFLLDLPAWLLNRLGLAPAAADPAWCPRRLATSPGAWSLLLLGALIAAGLPRTLQPLHGNRAGHHAAGRWLAAHARPCDLVEDNHCWAHYYAGRVFEEGKPPAALPADGTPRLRYSVVARARERDPKGAQREQSEAELQRRGARVVFHHPPQRPVARADVVIYAQPLPAASPAP